MEFLSEMWMPIVVSAVFVWIASSIIHMVLPHHKKEFAGLPDEETLNTALEGVKPGQYMFPWAADMEEMKDPAYIEKQKKGPCGVLTVWPGPANFGRNLGMMLAFYLVVGAIVAYVVHHSGVNADTPYMTMFRIAGTTAFMAHGLGWMPGMVWFGQKGFWTYTFDALVYALVTAGVFGWLG
jgi:hypothetical protein